MTKIGSMILMLLLAGHSAGAMPLEIRSAEGLAGLGSFSGWLDYSASSATSATLTVSLSNTSAAGNGGFLVAFVLNNPGFERVTTSTSSLLGLNTLLGGGDFSGGVATSPFGAWDFGLSTSGAFLGGGSPRGGLAAGQTGTFRFDLVGSDLHLLTSRSFAEAFNSGGSQGNYSLLARFRGFENGGSDKVPGRMVETAAVPEPATLSLVAIGLGSALARRLSGRARRSRQ